MTPRVGTVRVTRLGLSRAESPSAFGCVADQAPLPRSRNALTSASISAAPGFRPIARFSRKREKKRLSLPLPPSSSQRNLGAPFTGNKRGDLHSKTAGKWSFCIIYEAKAETVYRGFRVLASNYSHLIFGASAATIPGWKWLVIYLAPPPRRVIVTFSRSRGIKITWLSTGGLRRGVIGKVG